MVKKTNEVLSKETRKLRKKKGQSENDIAIAPPTEERITRRMSTRFSSLQLSNNSTNKTSTTRFGSNGKDKGKGKATDMVVVSDEGGDAGQDDYAMPEPPSTPIPQANSPQDTDSESDNDDDSEDCRQNLVISIRYDPVDEYDTDELLEQLDNLSPLRQNLAEDGSTKRRQKGRGRGKKGKNNKRGGGNKQKATGKRRAQKYVENLRPPRPVYNHERTMELSKKYPDDYWAFHADNSNMIGDVNAAAPLGAIHHIKEQGPVLGMALSKDGALLATFCTLGTVKIWDIQNNFRLLEKLRDESEPQIDEFYCGLFQNQYLVATGKLKDRHKWSTEDEDCHILPCPIKIFDLNNGKVVCRLEGHAEEVLCVKSVQCDNKNYYVSTSQDGYIIRWEVEEDWRTFVKSTKMADGITCMAFSISFLPNTGNKYFLGACDAHLRLYDLETAQLLQTFEGLYSSYCDCGKFINLLNEEDYLAEEAGPSTSESNAKHDKIQASSQGDESALVDIENDDLVSGQGGPSYAWLITRGAEMVDGDIITVPNSCTLHQLVYPTKTGERFELKDIRRYGHEGYRANSWMVKVTSNGRYLFAPTMEGQIFMFNLLTGQTTGILKTHEDLEVRDVILHPYAPLLFSCGDDGLINVYTYISANDENNDSDDDKTNDK